MTWTVTFHPALAGEVAAMASSISLEVLIGIHQLAAHGVLGLDPARVSLGLADRKSSCLREVYVSDKSIILTSRVSMVKRSAEVLSIRPAGYSQTAGPDDMSAAALATRLTEVEKGVCTLLSLEDFLLNFSPDDVAYVARLQAHRKRTAQETRALKLAYIKVQEEIGSVLNLGPLHLRRLEMKYDYVSDTLRKYLNDIGADVGLRISFADGGVYQLNSLADLSGGGKLICLEREDDK